MARGLAVTRRQILAAVPLLSMAAVEAGAQATSRTFVLVHGGWHGGWCWNKVAPLIIAAGHRVYTPTLTGLGERAHLLTPAIGLETHIEDVCALLFYEDLHDVVLVGHSYAGMVIAGAAPRLVDRLSRVVYLDAFLPDDGKCLEDYVDRPPTPDGIWRLPPPGAAPRWGVTNETDIAWMEARLGDQPVKTFKDRVRITADISSRVPHSYIQCTKLPQLVEAAARARRRGFRVREQFSGGHDLMISKPDDLAPLLLE